MTPTEYRHPGIPLDELEGWTAPQMYPLPVEGIRRAGGERPWQEPGWSVVGSRWLAIIAFVFVLMTVVLVVWR